MSEATGLKLSVEEGRCADKKIKVCLRLRIGEFSKCLSQNFLLISIAYLQESFCFPKIFHVESIHGDTCDSFLLEICCRCCLFQHLELS